MPRCARRPNAPATTHVLGRDIEERLPIWDGCQIVCIQPTGIGICELKQLLAQPHTYRVALAVASMCTVPEQASVNTAVSVACCGHEDHTVLSTLRRQPTRADFPHSAAKFPIAKRVVVEGGPASDVQTNVPMCDRCPISRPTQISELRLTVNCNAASNNYSCRSPQLSLWNGPRGICLHYIKSATRSVQQDPPPPSHRIDEEQ